MTPKRSAADLLPEASSVASLREAAAHCRGCDLYKDATQTVSGDGPERAKVMFVGEQPGDSEDTQGRDQELRNIEMAGFIADLKLVCGKLAA